MSTFSRTQHLIAIVLAGFLFCVWWVFHYDYARPASYSYNLTFIEVSGHVEQPGVYSFTSTPSLKAVISCAGGLTTPARIVESGSPLSFASGTHLYISPLQEGMVGVKQEEMSVDKRITLGIPLDVNRASKEELELLPYVRPQQAVAIIELREQAGGFTKVEDLLAIKGLGPATIKKLRPFVKVSR